MYESTKQDSTSPQPSRRRFLQSTAIAGSAATLLATPSWAHAAGTDETLRIGLIGAGGRGTGAAIDALSADGNAKLVAIGDTFRDRAEGSLAEIKRDPNVGDRAMVDDEHIFSDFDAFKKVIDCGVDVVLLTTPPHFRPEHLRYAVEQGKHVFVEKPVAVDAPGVRHIEESCRMAGEKGLSIVSGALLEIRPGRTRHDATDS